MSIWTVEKLQRLRAPIRKDGKRMANREFIAIEFVLLKPVDERERVADCTCSNC
jgi:hypothetical protein